MQVNMHEAKSQLSKLGVKVWQGRSSWIALALLGTLILNFQQITIVYHVALSKLIF